MSTEEMNMQELESQFNEQERLRREKLVQLQAEGKDPFDVYKVNRTHSSQEIKDNFESLEGKFCSTPVTFKVTEDETMTTQLFINVNVPLNIIIDGNNKLLTNNLSTDYQGLRFTFQDAGCFSTIRIININFEGQGKTSTTQLVGLTFVAPNNNIYIENCTFSKFSFACINTTSTNVNINNCTFNNSNYGFYNSRGSNNFCRNSSFTNLNAGFGSEKGNIVRSFNNTFSSVTTQYQTQNDSKTMGSFYVYNS